MIATIRDLAVAATFHRWISPMFVGVTSRFQASVCSTAFVDVARG
jgi:hypothetical protein